MFQVGDTVKLKKSALSDQRRIFRDGKGIKKVQKYLAGSFKINRIFGSNRWAEAEFDFPKEVIKATDFLQSDAYWYTTMVNLVPVKLGKRKPCNCSWVNCPGRLKAKAAARKKLEKKKAGK